jgi:hypothetical protein
MAKTGKKAFKPHKKGKKSKIIYKKKLVIKPRSGRTTPTRIAKKPSSTFVKQIPRKSN